MSNEMKEWIEDRIYETLLAAEPDANYIEILERKGFEAVVRASIDDRWCTFIVRFEDKIEDWVITQVFDS